MSEICKCGHEWREIAKDGLPEKEGVFEITVQRLVRGGNAIFQTGCGRF